MAVGRQDKAGSRPLAITAVVTVAAIPNLPANRPPHGPPANCERVIRRDEDLIAPCMHSPAHVLDMNLRFHQGTQRDISHREDDERM